MREKLPTIVGIMVLSIGLVIGYTMITMDPIERYTNNERYIVHNNDDDTITTWKCEEIE